MDNTLEGIKIYTAASGRACIRFDRNIPNHRKYGLHAYRINPQNQPNRNLRIRNLLFDLLHSDRYELSPHLDDFGDNSNGTVLYFQKLW